MDAGERFKKAIVGGFDKDDVMNYFEKTQRKHREEVMALRSELDAQIERADSFEDQCADQSETISDLSERIKRSEKELKILSDEKNLLTEENSALKKKNEEIQKKAFCSKSPWYRASDEKNCTRKKSSA